MRTVKSWTQILERLYLVFTVRPFARGLARGLRREPKGFFWDGAAANNGTGARLENLVACAILEYCHLEFDTTGGKMRLHYFRDREKRGVDFVVTEGRRVK
jgi:hypothetical protein